MGDSPHRLEICVASARPAGSSMTRLYQEARLVTIVLIQSARVQRGKKVASGSGLKRQEGSTVSQTSLPYWR
jgi:hypothetical protein